jgi:hypothetical protein
MLLCEGDEARRRNQERTKQEDKKVVFENKISKGGRKKKKKIKMKKAQHVHEQEEGFLTQRAKKDVSSCPELQLVGCHSGLSVSHPHCVSPIVLYAFQLPLHMLQNLQI